MIPTAFVRFEPKPGMEAQVESILRGMVLNSRAEPGCLVYDLFDGTDPAGAKRYFLMEKYRDEDALQAHRETAHYKAYRADILDMLEQPPIPTLVSALDAIIV